VAVLDNVTVGEILIVGVISGEYVEPLAPHPGQSEIVVTLGVLVCVFV
jgi:hypothetical protein